MRKRRSLQNGGDDVEQLFFDCLSEISFIKKQLSENKKYQKLLEKKDFPRVLKKHPKFKSPELTLNTVIMQNINNKLAIDPKGIYLTDLYRHSYIVLQLFNNQSALFYDRNNDMGYIYFIAPDGVDLSQISENESIYNVADYFTFEGVTQYKNLLGFNRQAYIFRGHLDTKLRENLLSYIYTKQFLDEINIEGM